MSFLCIFYKHYLFLRYGVLSPRQDVMTEHKRFICRNTVKELFEHNGLMLGDEKWIKLQACTQLKIC